MSLAFLIACGTPAGTPSLTASPPGAAASPAATLAIGSPTGSPVAAGSPTGSPTTTAAASPGASPTGAASSPATGASSATDCQATTAVVPGTAGASAATAEVGRLVSRSDVESVIGTVSGAGARVDIPLPGIVATACVWTSSDGNVAVALGPRNIAKADFESFMRLVPGTTSVNGVGDSAFAVKASATGTGGAASIFVLSGGQYFTIQAASRSRSSDALLTGITDLANKAAKLIP